MSKKRIILIGFVDTTGSIPKKLLEDFVKEVNEIFKEPPEFSISIPIANIIGDDSNL